MSRRGEGERRVLQTVRIDDLGLVANLHVTSALADEQFLRAATIVEELADPDEPVILCGDVNVRPGSGRAYGRLSEWGYSEPAPSIDQILVRGLPSTPPLVWPDERRRSRWPTRLRPRAGRTPRRMTFEEARAQFPVLERYAYLNAGTNGPIARATADAVIDQTRRDLEHGRSGKEWFERILALREEARTGLAAVLDVDPLHVALTDSTSRGCSIVLSGLGLGPDDEVVMTDQEHFGLTAAVHAAGVRVVLTEGDEDAILAAVTPRTRLIATSHVLWTNGRRLDLRRVREQSGLPVLVDGAQSAGAIVTGAGDFDFYTVSAQKWLCGPEPTGALFVQDPERLRHRLSELSVADVVRAHRRVRREGGIAALRRRLDPDADAARAPRGTRRASRVALRAGGRPGGPVP